MEPILSEAGIAALESYPCDWCGELLPGDGSESAGIDFVDATICRQCFSDHVMEG